jgi:threonine synthase
MTTVLRAQRPQYRDRRQLRRRAGDGEALFNDPKFAGAFNLSAVNSINWARLMAQVVYYFYAAVRLGAPERRWLSRVPTGNFGDVFAGYVAAKMGLPVARLIVATNVNDILHRALTSGDYSAGRSSPDRDAEHGHSGQLELRAAAVRPVGRDGAGAGRHDGAASNTKRDDDPSAHAGGRADAVFHRASMRTHGARDALGL